MNTIMNWVENSLVPKVSYFTEKRYFQALRNGFFAIMPLTIIGSIFMLITDFPIPGYAEFMNGIFGENWISYISPAYRATFNMMGFIFAGTMSYKLADSYDMDKLTSLVLALVAYVVVLPKTVISGSGEVITDVLSFGWLGTKGVVTAIFVSIISVEIARFCYRKNLVIHLPNSVPEMVGKAFSALIPGILIVTTLLIINGICMATAGSLPELIFNIIQVPLQGIVGSPWAIIIVAGLNGLLWWFGVHPTVINSLIYPLLYANAASNQTFADVGQLTASTGAFGTVQMLDQFATIGGAGCTIGLIISMLIVVRSSRLKAMSKISAIPALFNINEPLVFGLPLVFNPMMLIPIVLAPIASVAIVYLSMSIGFMPLFTNVQAPWACPFFFSGFLVAGWKGAVTQLLCVAATVLIYMPFVKALDRQYVKEENN